MSLDVFAREGVPGVKGDEGVLNASDIRQKRGGVSIMVFVFRLKGTHASHRPIQDVHSPCLPPLPPSHVQEQATIRAVV